MAFHLPPLERPLQVSRHLDDEEAKENGSVTLSCAFAPSPRVVKWFKGRTALKSSNKYSMKREGKRAQLTVHGMTAMDAGQYHCMAGGSQSTAHVKVEGRLNIVLRKIEACGKVTVSDIQYFQTLPLYVSLIDDLASFISPFHCSANAEVG